MCPYAGSNPATCTGKRQSSRFFYKEVVLKNFSKFRSKHKKQSSKSILSKSCSKDFRKIYKKSPVLESLFNKVGGQKTCNLIRKTLVPMFLYSVNFVKFSRQLFCRTCPSDNFWHYFVFFLFSDQWRLQSKNILLGGIMLN